MREWQGHLLSCFRQLKNHYGDISGPAFVKIIVPDLTSFPLVMLRPWYSVLMLSGHMSQMLRVCFLSFWNSSWFPTIVNILLSFTVHHIYEYNKALKDALNAGCKLFEMNRYIYIIPEICHLFYTHTFWGLKILHSKVRKFRTKKASRQNSVKLHTVCKITHSV